MGGDNSLGGVGLNGGVVDVGGLDDLAERLGCHGLFDTRI